MDNRLFDIVSDSGLDHALAIAFEGVKATNWREEDGERHRRLVLAWHAADQTWVPFPAPIDAVDAEAIIRLWLDAQDYGPEPDHDGHNSKGWRVYCEAWGHVGHNSYAFMAVEPHWAMYGK